MTKLLTVLFISLFTAQAFAINCTLSYKADGSNEKKVLLKRVHSPSTKLILVGELESVSASYGSDIQAKTEELYIATADGSISMTNFKINSQDVMVLRNAVNDNWASVKCVR